MINEELKLELSFPPTVNNYYVKTRSGVFISAKGRKYRNTIADEIHQQLSDMELGEERINLNVVVHMPDRRKRDLDNYMKALLDAITKTGLWEDDSQIDQLCIYRGEIIKGGKVRMEIAPAGPVLSYSYWVEG